MIQVPFRPGGLAGLEIRFGVLLQQPDELYRAVVFLPAQLPVGVFFEAVDQVHYFIKFAFLQQEEYLKDEYVDCKDPLFLIVRRRFANKFRRSELFILLFLKYMVFFSLHLYQVLDITFVYVPFFNNFVVLFTELGVVVYQLENSYALQGVIDVHG